MDNYNQSSEGVSLELSCFCDSYLAQMNFDESFKRTCFDDVFQFIDSGNFTEKELEDINYYDFSKDTIKNTILEWYGCIEDVRSESNNLFDKPFSKLNKDEMKELLVNACAYDGKNETIELYQKDFNPKYETIVIRGYVQGTYAEVIFFDEDIEEYNFKDREEFLSDMTDQFTHLFYDAPVHCRLTIDDEEVYLDEALTSQYDWDRDLILAYAKDNIEHEKKEYILKWLDDNLPDYPEHN